MSMEGEVAPAAAAAGAGQLESAVRWQYLFEESYMFDSTLPGWHSYGREEAARFESLYHAMDKEGSEPCAMRVTGGGYEYEVDLRGMAQTNLKTGKSRAIRRVELHYRRKVVKGGGSFSLSVDLAEHEEARWAWEVMDDLRIDFVASFSPLSSPSSAGRRRGRQTQQLVKATRAAHAWSFAAPQAGRVSFCWTNSFSMAAHRLLLLDCGTSACGSSARPREDVLVREARAEELALPSLESFCADDAGPHCPEEGGPISPRAASEEGCGLDDKDDRESSSPHMAGADAGLPTSPRAAAGVSECGDGEEAVRLVGDEESPATASTGRGSLESVADPPYWSGRAPTCSEGWLLEPVCDEATLDALRLALTPTKPEELGRGYDVRKYPRKYRRLELHAAWRIESPAAFRIFAERRSQVARQVAALRRARLAEAQVDAVTGAAWGDQLPGPVDPAANEAWLLHGCTPGVVMDICQHGLSERLSSMGGAFGAGIYLAENIEKIDQYTAADYSFCAEGLEALHGRLFATAESGPQHPRRGEQDARPGSPADLFYCFVVRAVCGWPVRTLGSWRKSRSPPAMDHDGLEVHQDATRRELAVVPGTGTTTLPRYRFNSLIAALGRLLMRWREFVIFDRTQTYTEYLVAYKRA